MFLAACLAACRVELDPSLAVNSAGGTLYPGAEVRCWDRCDDMTEEIRRWIQRELPEGADLASVTWHRMVDAKGNEILLERTGGFTWMAVATLTDGSRVALLVGCGAGLDTERCFSGR